MPEEGRLIENSFRIEAVGARSASQIGLPSKNLVQEWLNVLWTICSGKVDKFEWTPVGEFVRRGRAQSDPRFRVRAFERGTENGFWLFTCMDTSTFNVMAC